MSSRIKQNLMIQTDEMRLTMFICHRRCCCVFVLNITSNLDIFFGFFWKVAFHRSTVGNCIWTSLICLFDLKLFFFVFCFSFSYSSFITFFSWVFILLHTHSLTYRVNWKDRCVEHRIACCVKWKIPKCSIYSCSINKYEYRIYCIHSTSHFMSDQYPISGWHRIERALLKVITSL